MARMLGYLEAMCLTTSDVAQGALSRGLETLCSSWGKLALDELLLEVGRGALMGAMEGLLGEEEGVVALRRGEGVEVTLEEGEEREEEEEGVIFIGGEEGEEDFLEGGREGDEEMGQAQEEGLEESGSAYTEEDAYQRAASSPSPAEAADSPSADPLAPRASEHSHDEGQRDSSRAGEAPLEVSLPRARLFSGDAFAVAEIPSGFGDIFSDPAFDVSRAPSPSPLPPAVSPRRFTLPLTLASQHPPLDALTWTEESALPPMDWEAVLAEREAEWRAARSSLLAAVRESMEQSIIILDGEEDMWRAALMRDWTQGHTHTTSTSSSIASAAPTAASASEDASLAGTEDAGSVPQFHDVIPLFLLGRGGQGEVYHAACLDAHGNYFPAAVKRARPSPGTDTMREQLRELSSLVACRGLNNVLQALGYVIFDDGELGIVLELAEAPPTWARHGAPVAHTPAELLRVARYGYQGASGLAGMHGRGRLHTDVKPENFLVSGEVAKLADLGFSVRADRAAKMGPCGTPGYIAPEVLLEGEHSKASDVFAMGMTIWALITGDRPGDYFSNKQECFRWYLADGRLAWPDEVSRFGGDLVALVERCWDPLPEQRPTAEELMRALLQIALRLEAAKRVWVE